MHSALCKEDLVNRIHQISFPLPDKDDWKFPCFAIPGKQQISEVHEAPLAAEQNWRIAFNLDIYEHLKSGMKREEKLWEIILIGR